MAPPSPDWQPDCSHCFEGENFLTYSHGFFPLLILNSKCFSLFSYFTVILQACPVHFVCLYILLSAYSCVIWSRRMNFFYVCIKYYSAGAKVWRKSVDGGRSTLIAWLINQLHRLHVDPGLLSGGLAEGLLWAHNDSLVHGVMASSGL